MHINFLCFTESRNWSKNSCVAHLAFFIEGGDNFRCVFIISDLLLKFLVSDTTFTCIITRSAFLSEMLCT